MFMQLFRWPGKFEFSGFLAAVQDEKSMQWTEIRQTVLLISLNLNDAIQICFPVL